MKKDRVIEEFFCDVCGWSKALGPGEPLPESCPRCHRKAAGE